MKDFVVKETNYEIDERVAGVREESHFEIAEMLLSPSGSYVNDFVVMYSSMRKSSSKKTLRIKTNLSS